MSSLLGIVIPTVGRQGIVEQTILSLARRRTLPNRVVVVGACNEDLPKLVGELPFRLDCILSPKGLTLQRNCGIKQLGSSVECVSFLDDDMEIHDDFCAEVENVFQRREDIVGFSGCILANGGASRPDARALLDAHQIPTGMPEFGFYPKHWPGFYGCSMNVRRQCLEMEQFDERLPLYALGEDCELGFRLSRHGAVGGSARCPVVHLAVRSGRISEVGVGYAQIINYLYFAKKGIGYPRLTTYYEKLCRTPITNLFFQTFPNLDRRASIDRKGRFRGNLLALRDVALGRIDPENLRRIVGDMGVDSAG